MNENESVARIKINELLKEAGWDILKDIHPENYTGDGFIDYLLLNARGLPIAVLEAKSIKHDPLDGKYQAEKYAKAKKCRFIILSNGEEHYFWDTEKATEQPILRFPSQKDLEKLSYYPEKKKLGDVPLSTNFIVQSQGNIDHSAKRYLRDYQLAGLYAIISGFDQQNKQRFLLEMATGTGKTLLAAAIIKLFLKSGNAQKVLFLVDRIELAQQAKQNLEGYLTEYTVCIFKEKKDYASSYNIVIATIQSLATNGNYRKYFSPFEFDLLISDEAHRGIYGSNKIILEYFEAIKLGLTATPNDFLKNINIDELRDEDPRKLEIRSQRDTYTTFGCSSNTPTYRFSLKDAVTHKPPYLVNPVTYDKRSNTTVKMLSEGGWSDTFVTEEGQEVEETFKLKDLERKVFSDALNQLMVEELFKVVKPDPITGEVGKTIIYCITQKHAGKIAHLLNTYADKKFPNKYKGRFARQITSNIVGAQELSKSFRNNRLDNTRIVTTVSMMTTGYDCPDLLNVVLMRPVFSPTEFIQIKGRGTRRYTFSDERSQTKAEKDNYHLIDFFAVCEYFEEKYDYSAPLKPPTIDSKKEPLIVKEPTATYTLPPEPPQPQPLPTKYIYIGTDGIIYDTVNVVGEKCMKVDRETYKDIFEEELKKLQKTNDQFSLAIRDRDFTLAQNIVEDNVLNKPKYFFTLDSLRHAYSSDNVLSDFIKKALGLIERLPTKYDRIDEEYQRLKVLQPLPSNKLYAIKEVFTLYLADKEYRSRLDNNDGTVLSDPNLGATLKPGVLTTEEIGLIKSYIKSNHLSYYDN